MAADLAVHATAPNVFVHGFELKPRLLLYAELPEAPWVRTSDGEVARHGNLFGVYGTVVGGPSDMVGKFAFIYRHRFHHPGGIDDDRDVKSWSTAVLNQVDLEEGVAIVRDTVVPVICTEIPALMKLPPCEAMVIDVPDDIDNQRLLGLLARLPMFHIDTKKSTVRQGGPAGGADA